MVLVSFGMALTTLRTHKFLLVCHNLLALVAGANQTGITCSGFKPEPLHSFVRHVISNCQDGA